MKENLEEMVLHAIEQHKNLAAVTAIVIVLGYAVYSLIFQEPKYKDGKRIEPQQAYEIKPSQQYSH